MNLNLRDTFDRLAAQWKRDIAFESSATRIVMHPAYRQIIDMGEDVVPFIIEDMRAGELFWTPALREISGGCPYGEELAGKMQAQTDAWLAWWDGGK